MKKSTTSDKTEQFSRVLRWTLGALFTGIGMLYLHEGGWPAILFGVAFFVTGFFRPRRCIDENCALPKNNSETINLNKAP